MVCGAFSYDHMLQLRVVNGTLNYQKYRDETLESDVRLSLNSLECQNMVLQDDNARPNRGIQKPTEHRNVSMAELDAGLETYQTLGDELGRRVRNRDPAVSNLRELRNSFPEEWGRMPHLNRM